MRRVGAGVGAESLPLRDVVVRDVGVVCSVRCVAGSVCDLSHGFNADDALDGEIGLVAANESAGCSSQREQDIHIRCGSGKIIRGDLVLRDERLADQIPGPLVQDVVVVGQVGVVVGSLGVREGHDEHVTAFFQRLLLVVAIVVSSGLGERTTNIVDAVCVRPVTCSLVSHSSV